ncbi:chloride channel protein [uncultured Prevotella sp.]|uniref:chloride channel protein n=1 Tax=uncultured Prevotella sp. TaxID=159272 RepID=UPI00263530C6|nr:chloride channel protein [uncultured Prevotella sp.]
MQEKKETRLNRLIAWRESHITNRQFTLILSFAVGFLAAVAASLLHLLIKQIQNLLAMGFSVDRFNWLYLIYPVVGIFITSLFVRYVVRDNISHGITRILYAISSKRSHLKAHNCWSSVIASAITIGCGGSVGAEAPIVLTGSAIGSNLGKLFKMDNKTLMLLVGCGAAAAIAGIFKAPIAGLVFTLEVLMIDLTMASLLPILIASVTAACFTYIFSSGGALFDFHVYGTWTLSRVPAYILLGVTGGFISLYFMRAMTACEGVFSKLKERPYAKLILGGLMLSTLIALFPVLYGEGYHSINILLNGTTEADWDQILNNSLFYGHSNLLVLYVALVVLTKVFATSATNGGGGCGGTFAPSLFIGAYGGFLFARLWNMYNIGVYVPEKHFVLLGMAAVMAGVMHAPLTGMFLIAEITGGYQLLLPLMIVSICAYLTIIIFEPHSIYGMRLAREGKLLTHHTDRSILTLMSIDSVIDKSYTHVPEDMELGTLVHAISRSHNTILPVIDQGGKFLGEIDMSKLRHIIFRTELYHHFKVRQLMSQPPCVLSVNDPMEEVMKRFDSTDAGMLPVLETDGTLRGYVSRSHLYSTYRKMVADMSAE